MDVNTIVAYMETSYPRTSRLGLAQRIDPYVHYCRAYNKVAISFYFDIKQPCAFFFVDCVAFS